MNFALASESKAGSYRPNFLDLRYSWEQASPEESCLDTFNCTSEHIHADSLSDGPRLSSESISTFYSEKKAFDNSIKDL